MIEQIKEFFRVFEWMPSTHGVESYRTPPMFFGLEHLILSIAGIAWVMPVLFSIMFAGLMIATLFGFEPKGNIPWYAGFYISFCFALIPAFFQQTARLCFLRKVTPEHLNAMEVWHQRFPYLETPNSDMTRRDLARYVDAAYEQEAGQRKKNSLLDV